MGLRMSGRRLASSPARGMTKKVTIRKVIEAAKSRDQPINMVDFVQYILRNPLVSEKQFCLAFVRILLTNNNPNDDDRSVLSFDELANYKFTGVSASSLRELVQTLLDAANEKLRKLDLEVRPLVRDVDGKEMIAVVTQMMRTDKIRTGWILSELELGLIFAWIHDMWNTSTSGEVHIETIVAFSIAESFRLPLERIFDILAFLCVNDFFIKTKDGFTLSWRGMYELDPELIGAIPLKMCSRCRRLVVMTQPRRVSDEMAHTGCAKKATSPLDDFTMIHYHYRIHGFQKVFQQYRHRRWFGRRRAEKKGVFEVTSEDEDDFDNESWSDGEEAHYEPTEIEKILLDEFGLDY